MTSSNHFAAGFSPISAPKISLDDKAFSGCSLGTPIGFSEEKAVANDWLDAVREFWLETKLDTDEFEIRAIVNWFDEKRRMLANGSDDAEVGH